MATAAAAGPSRYRGGLLLVFLAFVAFSTGGVILRYIASDDGFAIQDQVRRRKFCECIGDRLKAPRPVVASARVHGRPSTSQVRLRAIAIELDLVHPTLA